MTRTTLAPQLVVDEQEREAGLRRLIYEAAFSNAGAALTTGVILTAYALHLGANNFAIGLLAAIPFLAEVVYRRCTPSLVSSIYTRAVLRRSPSAEESLSARLGCRYDCIAERQHANAENSQQYF